MAVMRLVWPFWLYRLTHFVLLPALFGRKVDAGSPVFWVAMQIAMLAGFATAYFPNWWLIRSGLKEGM